MKRTSNHQPIFVLDALGSLVQAGTDTTFSSNENTLHDQTRDRAFALSALFKKHGLSIDKSPTLSKLFNDTVKRSEIIESGCIKEHPTELVFNSAQIKKSFGFGIVALNIDDLAPPNSLASASTMAMMTKFLEQRIESFMRDHERHLRRYLEPSRAVALVSFAILADVRCSRPRWRNIRQTVLWHIPGELSDRTEQIVNLIKAFK
ncbi:hypothetical protein [Candidatus Nitrotoga arctica]|uniref:Uncharacterized protein n=1 Tax=Candidatus Nitrotoga arctica TaxID=453162 RepID=A0ABN8AHL4_9PROT|nr:hypothetical protein [Candidatus Nitrotoga arctica]CAG9932218.1 protein of unknown function [Candidatus Nitrotoga arctica]